VKALAKYFGARLLMLFGVTPWAYSIFFLWLSCDNNYYVL
jgi:hypothetical protein